ncbi:hypothetical protein SADUNF_Sadunf16G0074000 [Salix dunnii]|uniref:Uncharacterized protein n=1 Tax=Salix dunnii TaxID=1413687 RepID=A0A835MPL2_9ROSI|nr:hypothetical protein SADUNF_Sadunf16G0074000 [Salix dunnii]
MFMYSEGYCRQLSGFFGPYGSYNEKYTVAVSRCPYPASTTLKGFFGPYGPYNKKYTVVVSRGPYQASTALSCGLEVYIFGIYNPKLLSRVSISVIYYSKLPQRGAVIFQEEHNWCCPCQTVVSRCTYSASATLRYCYWEERLFSIKLEWTSGFHFVSKKTRMTFSSLLLRLPQAVHVSRSALDCCLALFAICLCCNWTEVTLELLSDAYPLSHLPVFCLNLLS